MASHAEPVGPRQKRCPGCCAPDEVLPVGAFYRNPARRDGLSANCRRCHHEIERRYYRRHVERERAKHRERRIRAQFASRARMVDYLSNCACLDCGNTDPVVLEFHLVLGTRHKRYDVSRLVTQGYVWHRIREEISKCIVLCANCHRIRTAGERGHYRAKVHSAGSSSERPL